MLMKRYVVYFCMIIVLGLFAFVVLTQHFTLDFKQLTGFAIYSFSGNDFSNGTHLNTTTNGTSILLAGSNITGNYTSVILDAGSNATWNNISWIGSMPTISYIYLVDGSGDVYSTVNLTNWTQHTTNYGRGSDTNDMFSDTAYLYTIASVNKEVWRSSNYGVNWSVINSTFADSSLELAEVNSNGEIFVADGSGDVYNSSTNGVTWTKRGDFNNGSTNKAKGIAINSSGVIFIFDASPNLYKSSNSGDNWTQISHNYTGAAQFDDMEVDSNGYLYILDNHDVWRSTNQGSNWTRINASLSSFASVGKRMHIMPDNSLYVVDAVGRLFSSTDGGFNWNYKSDSDTSVSANALGVTSILRPTNISFQYRNCTLANCSDGTWISNTATINVTSRYFQYRVILNSPLAGYTPSVTNISVNYDLTDLAPQFGTLVESPTNNSVYNPSTTYLFNITVNDTHLTTVKINFNGTNYTLSNQSSVYLFNISNLAVGTYTYYWTANDTLGKTNTSNVRIYVIAPDTSTPQFGTIVENPTSGVTYDYQGMNHYFNITVNGTTLSLVKINFNGTNYTLSNQSSVYLFNISNLAIGNYSYYYWAMGTNNNTNVTMTRTYMILQDTSAPQFSGFVVSPASGNSYVPGSTHYFNVTVGLGNISLVKINFNSTNYTLNNQSDVYLFSQMNLSAGNYDYYYWANLSNGNTNVSLTQTYIVTPDTTKPLVSLFLPSNGQQYGYNTSIKLNYTVSDPNLGQCWYAIDGGSNISLSSCSNTSFSISNGAHTLIVYANDTFGNIGFDNSSFNVNVGSPSILQGNPDGPTNTTSITFYYTTDDPDGISSCELWGDFGNGYLLNKTNTTITSGVQTSFSLNLGEGNYYWNIRCNDTFSFEARTSNKTFTIDTTKPLISLTQPTGTKNSRTNIPLTYSVSDTQLNACTYNVYHGVTMEISNTSINCSAGSINFNVTIDANFILNFYASDLAGNMNSSSIPFTVDTTPTASCGDNVCNGIETCTSCSIDCGVCGPTGGGGGGGGGSGLGLTGAVISSGVTKLDIKELNAILSLGEERALEASVKNVGRVAANKCRFVADKEHSQYVESNDLVNIGVGEIVDMKFLVKASVEGIDKLKLNVECLDNVTSSVPLKIKLIKPSLDLKLKKISFDKTALNIEYSIDSAIRTNQALFFRISNSNGEVFSETSQTLSLNGLEYLGNVKLDLAKAKAGMLKVAVLDEKKDILIEETVIYDGSKGFTGFASLTGEGGIISYLSLTIQIFVILILIVIVRIFKHRKS